MKKFFGIAATVVVLTAVGALYAHDAEMGCCSGAKKGAAATGANCCGDSLSKLNLTPDQKTRIESLKESCRSATSTSERMAMMKAGLEKILSPAQLEQWTAGHQGMAKSSKCPMASSGCKKSS